MVQITAFIICILSTHLVFAHSTTSGTETHRQDPPEVTQQLPQLQHNISKRFLKFPILLPAIIPRIRYNFEKRYTNLYSPVLYRYKRSLPSVPDPPEVAQQLPQLQHNISKRFLKFPILLPAIIPRRRIRYNFRKRYTTNLYSPALYRYKRSLPAVEASSLITTNPTIESSAITFLDGGHVWDNISAILALLQSLKQALLNIYQTTNVQAFLEWNQKALNLLARVSAFGIKFVPVQNNTVLFNLGAVVPLKNYLVPTVDGTGSVGITRNVNTNDGTAQIVPGLIHREINIVETNKRTVSTPPADLSSIYSPQPATQGPRSISVPVTARKSSGAGILTSNVNDKSNGNINVENDDVGRNSPGIDSFESPLSTNLLGDFDRRKKRSIEFGPGVFGRAQSNFRRMLRSFEGFSSNSYGTIYKPRYRRIPQHGRWMPQNGGCKIHHYQVPKWEFPKNDVVKAQKQVTNETTIEGTIEKSAVEVEEFNSLPHFDRQFVFDDKIEGMNNNIVGYLHGVSSVPFFNEADQFESGTDDSASVKSKVYVQVRYSKPELAHEYVDGGNVNSGDFRALPNFQAQQKFDGNEDDFSIDPRFASEAIIPRHKKNGQGLSSSSSSSVRHTFVEAPRPIEQTRPFVLQLTSSEASFSSPSQEPRPFVGAKPLERSSRLFVINGEQGTFDLQKPATLVDPQKMPFLNSPTEEATFTSKGKIQKTNEGEAKSLDEGFETVEVFDSTMFRLKNRFRKLPKVELKDRFKVGEEPSDLVRRPISDFIGDETVKVVTDGKENLLMRPEVHFDHDKKKIGRKIIYKRIIE